MRSLILIAVVLFGVGAVAWSSWSRSVAPNVEVDEFGAVADARSAADSAAEGPLQQGDPGSHGADPSVEDRRVSVESGAAPLAGKVAGRVVDSAGEPVADVRICVVRKPGWFDREWFRDPGAVLPAPLKSGVEVASDVSGHFEVVPHSADEPLELLVLSSRHGLERKSLAPTGGQVVDVGEIRLSLGVRVSGRVIDDSGRAVEGAAVMVADPVGLVVVGGDRTERGARTDAEGRFELLLRDSGDFALLARHPDHATGRHAGRAAALGDVISNVTIRLGASAEIAGVLTGAPADAGEFEIRAAKVRSGPRTPVDGVGLDFEMPLRFGSDRAKVESDGAFRLRGLERGVMYRLAAFDVGSGEGWRGVRVSDEVERESGSTSLQLAYRDGVRVVFRATDGATGRALERVEAEAKIDRTGGLATAIEIGALGDSSEIVCDADGSFRLDPIRPEPGDRTFTLTVAADGFAEFKRAKIVLPASGELDLGEIELRPAPVLRVRVTDAAGEPVAAARVRFQPEVSANGGNGVMVRAAHVEVDRDGVLDALGDVDMLTGNSRQRGRTDVAGFCELTLEPGRRGRLLVKHPDFAPHRGENLVAPMQGKSDSKIELVDGGHALVRVIDSAGAIVPGAKLECRRAGSSASQPTRAESGADGFARFAHLADGDYVVEFRGDDEPGAGFTVRSVTRISRRGEPEAERELPANGFRIERGSRVELTLVRPDRSTLSGTITVDGEALDGARVRIERGGDSQVDSAIAGMMPDGIGLPGFGGETVARTNDSGAFEFDAVNVGSVTLVVTHPSRAMPERVPVEVVKGETKRDIALTSTRILGRVVDSGGQPVRRARVSARRVSGATVGRAVRVAFASVSGDVAFGSGGARSVRTDSDGSFELVGIAADTPIELVVRSRDHADLTSVALTVSPGETKRDVELVVELGGSINVEIRGEAPAFSFVTARPADSEANGDTKSGMVQNGRLKLRGLMAGRWIVRLQYGNGGESDEREVDVVAGETARVAFDR